VTNWAYALDRQAPTGLRLALAELRRQGLALMELAGCNGDPCGWVRGVAECLEAKQCRGAVIFCADASPACVIANKVPGIRAAKVDSVAECESALLGIAANVLIVNPAGRTYYEFKEMLRLCLAFNEACPAGVACVIEDLERALSEQRSVSLVAATFPGSDVY
jgi:hypothetical protein